MKYTPGPWTLNENNNWKTNPFSITVRKPGVHSTTIVNIPTRMTIPPQEQQANARLVSAAPELYEALAWLMRQVPEPSLQGEYTTGYLACKVALHKAINGDGVGA